MQTSCPSDAELFMTVIWHDMVFGWSMNSISLLEAQKRVQKRCWCLVLCAILPDLDLGSPGGQGQFIQSLVRPATWTSPGKKEKD